jgi:acyl carrier protein
VKPDDARALLTRLLAGIAPEADLTDIEPDALLQDELDLDSMDFLNLITALHDETRIDVPERDYAQLATVNGFVAYVTAAAARSAT